MDLFHNLVTYRILLWAGELHCVPLDGVQGGVRGVARVRGRSWGQRDVGLSGLGDLNPPDRHQLHQLK